MGPDRDCEKILVYLCNKFCNILNDPLGGGWVDARTGADPDRVGVAPKPRPPQIIERAQKKAKQIWGFRERSLTRDRVTSLLEEAYGTKGPSKSGKVRDQTAATACLQKTCL